MKGDEKMKTENNPDYDRKKLEARKKMARTQQEMKDKMNKTILC